MITPTTVLNSRLRRDNNALERSKFSLGQTCLALTHVRVLVHLSNVRASAIFLSANLSAVIGLPTSALSGFSWRVVPCLASSSAVPLDVRVARDPDNLNVEMLTHLIKR